MASVSSELSSAEAELRELKPEHVRLQKKLDDAKRNLEDETLKRIDLQNQLQTEQENMKFQNNLLEQQLNETRIRKKLEISELDGHLQQKYEEKLAQNMAEVRGNFDKQMQENRDQLSNKYEKKIKDTVERLNSTRADLGMTRQELRESETKVTGLISR